MKQQLDVGRYIEQPALWNQRKSVLEMVLKEGNNELPVIENNLITMISNTLCPSMSIEQICKVQTANDILEREFINLLSQRLLVECVGT